MSAQNQRGRPDWAARIQAEREARSWSFTRAAAHLRRRDPKMPDSSTLAKYWAQRWESGQVKPGDHYRQHLCALLRLPADLFDDVSTRTPDVHFRSSETPLTVADEISLLTGEDLAVMAANESAEHARRHGASNAHRVSLEQLEADVHALADDFVSGFPVPVMLRARATRDQAFSLLDGHQWPAQSRQLYSFAGWACGLLSVGSSDFFGHYGPAATQCRTAWLCAEMSDDNGLRAWVRALESGIAFWAGRWSQAAVLAAQAREHSFTAPSAMRAATAQARALARLGDTEAARRAISDSEVARDLPAGEEARGVAGFTEANRIRCAGTALLWLGDYDAAQVYLQQALDAYDRDEPDAYAHITVTRADLASSRLHAGDVEAAADALGPLLSFPAERRLAGVTRRMDALRAQLDSPQFRSSPAARELGERIENLPPGLPAMASDED